jgi:hypothetical protein
MVEENKEYLIEKLKFEIEETKRKAKETQNNEDVIYAINKIVDNGIKLTKTFLNEFKRHTQQEIDVKQVKDIIDGLYSTVYCSIISTIKNTFLSPENKKTIPNNEMKEFEKFIRKWDKYTIENSGFVLLTEDYEKFRKEIKRLDNSKKIENFYKILETVEKNLNMELLIKKIDELNKNVEEFFRKPNKKKSEPLRFYGDYI